MSIIQSFRERLLKKETIVHRESLEKAIDNLNIKQIISIIGVRRCGKSTLMRETAKYILNNNITELDNILYLNLENPYFNQYKDDITYLSKIYETFKEKINKKRKVFIFLDEIQFFKDWQVFVKDLYERDEAKIILTGSNSKLLSSELATLLSGRSISVNMYPYSFTESRKAIKTLKINDYFLNGGFPEIVLLKKKEQIKLLAENYYKNIIYQDVIPRFGIKNSLEIENLSYYLLSNVGKELSYNTLKNISKLDDKTIKQYISYLEDANLLYLINNYNPSLKKQIGNNKKIYAVDFSFINYLGFNISPNYGRLLENAVYLDLRRKGKEIYFFKEGNECDFVTKQGYKITDCIQVTKNMDEDKTKEREVEGLVKALEYFKLKSGTIITLNTNENIMHNNLKINIVSYEEWLKK